MNYDKRTPLHIACSQGHFNIVKYLVETIHFPLDPVDRWNRTPLADSFDFGNDEISKYLSDHGAVLLTSDNGRELCQASSNGLLLKAMLLLNSGTDVNCSDGEGRTPLHLASEKGDLKMVELLIENNADINITDRWGSTSISDALKYKYFDLAEYLRLASAKTADLEVYKTSEKFISSLHRTVIILLTKDDWDYSTAWVSNEGFVETSEVWNTETNLVPQLTEWRQASERLRVPIDNNNILGRSVLTMTPQWIENSIETEDLVDKNLVVSSGFKSALFVPVMINNVLLCILELRSFKIQKKNSEIIENILATANRMITGNLRQFDGINKITGVFADQFNEVVHNVLASGFFSEKVVRKETEWYFSGLGMHEFYWRQFTPLQISKHVLAFIAAKLQGQTTNTSGAIRYRSEDLDSALYIYPLEEAAHVERRIESRWIHEGYQSSTNVKDNLETGISIKSFSTSGTASPDSQQRLIIYVISSDKYVCNPEICDLQKESSVWKIATGSFLCQKTYQARKRYEHSIENALKKNGLFIEEDVPTKRSNTPQDSVVIMATYKKGSTHSFLSSISLLLERSGFNLVRKYVETFANGYISYSFHVIASSTSKIDHLLSMANLTWLLPRTTLSPMVEQGILELPVALWAYCGWKFVYHFLTTSSDEWKSILKNLGNNPTVLSELLKFKKRLHNEVATETRISETILANPEIVKEMYQDFNTSFSPKVANRKAPTFNNELWTKILKTVLSSVDQEVLYALLQFNKHILKTNFYKSEKIALSFRMDPSFLADCDYTIIPFGLFLVIGAEFRGFHVRFDDVARGGIRLIQSRTKQIWQRNAEGLFDENYNLALTQTLKNKDIPESGSKGTIFLNVDHQDKSAIAFQKYIDSILDCILPSPQIIDYFCKTEILFFGPDEGTANFMDWAALHARSRGYPFWASITTGKSQELGGIPHDFYGMTTRGVHQFVLGIIKNLNLDESQLTKLQTGGPDGDLGSNEIKISKDKTIAIVDGSGVLYDPLGINRVELVRLADLRETVSKFDRNLLGNHGFLVLVDDVDIKLPDGRIIDNGMNFRNNFHFDPLCSADLFVPCGGRPASVNLSNVEKLFIGPLHKPIFKYIVEGANLFFTQEARLKLEEAGVILFKDASSNKGGVTSSSAEVLASLSMNDEEYSRLMCVKDNVIPKFYKQYVIDTQNRIQENADAEFNCLWNETKDGSSKCLLTDHLSERINQLNYQIRDSGLWNDQTLVYTVLSEVIPMTLQKELGLETIISRLPKSYVEATLSSYLAARYVYSHGLKANEFAFYQFMAKYKK